MKPFVDRREAGRRLSRPLLKYSPDASGQRTIVFGLPRGGLPVAYEVARALSAPLDVFIVRKIGVPWHSELAMGAIASGGIVVRNEDVIRHMGVEARDFSAVVSTEMQELERREVAYRGDNPQATVSGATCILVDDGIATGASMMAAVLALRAREPARIVVAAPVGSPMVHTQFAGKADEVICLHTPRDFTSVGLWYEDFDQTTDEEVTELLREARTLGAPWTLPGDELGRGL
jgi:putative phosphoribosyl transferase